MIGLKLKKSSLKLKISINFIESDGNIFQLKN